MKPNGNEAFQHYNKPYAKASSKQVPNSINPEIYKNNKSESSKSSSASNKNSNDYQQVKNQFITNSAISNISENCSKGEYIPLKYGNPINEAKRVNDSENIEIGCNGQPQNYFPNIAESSKTKDLRNNIVPMESLENLKQNLNNGNNEHSKIPSLKDKMPEIQKVTKVQSIKEISEGIAVTDKLNQLIPSSVSIKQTKQQGIKNSSEFSNYKKTVQDPSQHLPLINNGSSPPGLQTVQNLTNMQNLQSMQGVQNFQSSLQGTSMKINSLPNSATKVNAIKPINSSTQEESMTEAAKEEVKEDNHKNKLIDNSGTDFQKSVLKNLIIDKKIPEQILHDETYKSMTKGFENNPDKIAEVLMNLYDIVIKPCKNEVSKNTPNPNDYKKQNVSRSPQRVGRVSNNQNKKQIGNKFSKNPQATISPPEKGMQKSFVNKIKEVKLEIEEDHICKVKHFHHLHPTNKIINLINKFGSLSYRNKEINYDIPLINQVYRKLGLNSITQKSNLTLDLIKNLNFMSELKEAMLRKLYLTLNNDNKIEIKTPQSGQQFRYCVLNGNNSALVKGLFRQRWWWCSSEKEDYMACNLLWTQWKKQEFISKMGKNKEFVNKEISSLEIKACNHLEFNYVLGNKKCMYYNLKSYYEMTQRDLRSIVPMTFHIENINDPEYAKFRTTFAEFERENALTSQKREIEESEENEETEGNSKNGVNNGSLKNYAESSYNVWIIKPGENSNRGNGINVSNNLKEIHRICQSKIKHTYIIQKYIENPLLINNRKFDIRCYGLYTSYNGIIKGYFYKEGYLRTSSKIFTLDNLSHKAIHLTNEAIQIKFDEFGKFEQGNKISYCGFQKYLEKFKGKFDISFYNDIYPRIREIITETMRSVYSTIDKNKRNHTFELFGYDFMIDENYKVYLIEANINPCLGVTSSFSAQFIPTLVENVFRIAIDPLFPPPDDFAKSKRNTNEILPEIKFELIFDEALDKTTVEELSNKNQVPIYEASEKDEVPETNAELYSEDEEK